jgi:hypothetical protein
MFPDPFSVTYNGSAKSLPRTATAKDYNRYNTADREFEMIIANNLRQPQDGIATVSIKLIRRLPDPTPGDAFDAYRDIRNSFGFSYSFDARTRAETSVDVPRLRSALDALVDSTLQGRLIGGEK